MSAFIVDPVTIDYLVASVTRYRHGHRSAPRTDVIWATEADVPDEFKGAAFGDDDYGWRLDLGRMTPDAIGGTLMRQNVRSVSYRYSAPGREYLMGPNDTDPTPPDDLPGPCDQRRVWRYKFQHPQTVVKIGNRESRFAAEINPAWVVQSCRCLEYQSCETPDYPQTVAYALTQAILWDAVQRMIPDDAPWGVTNSDLVRTMEAAS